MRSTLEYIVAVWLSSLENDNITLLGEWYIGDYRPDFRVEISGKVRLVVEVKSNKAEADLYLAKYKQLINSLGYRYVVIYKHKHFTKLIKRFNIDTDRWKNESVYDYSGTNNPRFGMMVSEETRRKIGNATRERCKNDTYMKQLKQSIRAGFTEESRLRISKSTKTAATRRRILADAKDPTVIVGCSYCGLPLKRKPSSRKEYEYCKAQCSQAHRKQIGIALTLDDQSKFDRFCKRLLASGKNIYTKYETITEETITKAKTDGIISRNTPISLRTIEKYFGCLDKFLQEMK